jgi:hypothetical protein
MEPDKQTEAAESDAELVEDVQHGLDELNIDEVVKERDEFKDIALRVQADFENYRKRAAVQLTDEVDRSTGRIIEAMLPVLDACEAAVAHGVEGVEIIWSSLQIKSCQLLNLDSAKHLQHEQCATANSASSEHPKNKTAHAVLFDSPLEKAGAQRMKTPAVSVIARLFRK